MFSIIKSQRFKAKNETKTKFGFNEAQIFSDIIAI